MDSKQQEIAELEKKLRSLEALCDELEAAVFERKKADLQNRLQVLLNTGGGAAVGGDVHAGRDFVGRDQYKVDQYSAANDYPYIANLLLVLINHEPSIKECPDLN